MPLNLTVPLPLLFAVTRASGGHRPASSAGQTLARRSAAIAPFCTVVPGRMVEPVIVSSAYHRGHEVEVLHFRPLQERDHALHPRAMDVGAANSRTAVCRI